MLNHSQRITAKFNANTQKLLSQAVILSGVSNINTFVLNAAIEKAQQIIASNQTIALSQQDALLLIKALEAPVQVNSRLQEAANRYHSKINRD